MEFFADYRIELFDTCEIDGVVYKLCRAKSKTDGVSDTGILVFDSRKSQTVSRAVEDLKSAGVEANLGVLIVALHPNLESAEAVFNAVLARTVQQDDEDG